MIFLLNYERVRYEVTELTRFRMAQTLHIEPTDIEVVFEADDKGELASGWKVKKLPPGMSESNARESCIAIARWMRDNYLIPRLIDARARAREVRGAA